MKNKFAKNDLIFYFQFQEFPTSLVSSCAIKHKDLIFNDEAEEPILSQANPKTKYTNCYVLEEEDSKHKTGGFKKGPMTKVLPKQQNPKVNVWRKNEPEENFDFFDDFKGKTDEKQVEKFKRNLEISFTKENSISITKSTFNDHLDPSYVPEEEVFSADNLFDNADKILGLQPTTLNLSLKKKVERPQLKIDPNPKIVNMDFLFLVNESLNYPKDEQLWYIFHPAAKSAFGPLSSPNIKEMYDSKMLDGNSEIRFIDIYNYKNKKPFTFFSLKEIENTTFLENIEFSPLLKVDLNSNSKAKQVEEKEKNSIIKQEAEKSSERSHEKNIVSTSKTATTDSVEQNTKIKIENIQVAAPVQPGQPIQVLQPEKTITIDQPPKAQEDDNFFGFGGKTKSNKVHKPVEVDIKLGKKSFLF